MKKIFESWKTTTTIISAVILISGFAIKGYTFSQKVDRVEQAIVNLDLIASKLTNVDSVANFLRLATAGTTDTTELNWWLSIPREPILDSKGKPREGEMFLQKEKLPWMGIRVKYNNDFLVIHDTLWSYPPKD